MTDDIQVEKDKFDAILKCMIASKPTPHKEMVSQSNAKRGKKEESPKNGQMTAMIPIHGNQHGFIRTA